jgi:hypothetical protein
MIRTFFPAKGGRSRSSGRYIRHPRNECALFRKVIRPKSAPRRGGSQQKYKKPQLSMMLANGDGCPIVLAGIGAWRHFDSPGLASRRALRCIAEEGVQLSNGDTPWPRLRPRTCSSGSLRSPKVSALAADCIRFASYIFVKKYTTLRQRNI